MTDNIQKQGISSSRFYMWRALFAMAHADGVVTTQEVDFLNESTKDLPLSDQQWEILRNDLKEKQDPAKMFEQITDAKDREEFFVMARVLCWSDGDYDAQEQKMMKALDEVSVERDAKALLSQSRKAVENIKANQDEFGNSHEEERSILQRFGDFLKRKG